MIDEILLDGRMPVRAKMAPEAFYRELDPGIRFAVRLLHAHGIDTGQSCQGGDGHSYELPTVDLWGSPVENAVAFAAVAHLHTYGLPVEGAALHWRIEHGLPVECFWRLTLSRACPERADERPMVWGYQFADRATSHGSLEP